MAIFLCVNILYYIKKQMKNVLNVIERRELIGYEDCDFRIYS